MEYTLQWGLDLGLEALDAVLLERSHGRIQIALANRIPYTQSIKNLSPSDCCQILREALRRWKQQIGAEDLQPVGVSFSTQHAVSRPIAMPRNTADIESVIEIELQQNPAFSHKETIYRYQLIPTDRPEEKRLLFAAYPSPIIRSLLLAFEQEKIIVETLQPSPVGLLNLLRYDIRDTSRSLIVHLKHDATEILLGSAKGVWFRSLAHGGQDLAKFLREHFALPVAECETIAQALFRGESRPPYAMACDEFLQPIFQEIQNAVDFQVIQMNFPKPQKVFVTGECAKIPGVLNGLSEKFQCWTERLQKTQRVHLSSHIAKSLPAENPFAIAPAIGVALQALGAVKGGPSFSTQAKILQPQPLTQTSRPTLSKTPMAPGNRSLSQAPLTRASAVGVLLAAGILTLALGLSAWQAKNRRTTLAARLAQIQIPIAAKDQTALQQEVQVKELQKSALQTLPQQAMSFAEKTQQVVTIFKDFGTLLDANFVAGDNVLQVSAAIALPETKQDELLKTLDRKIAELSNLNVQAKTSLSALEQESFHLAKTDFVKLTLLFDLHSAQSMSGKQR